MGWKLMGRKAQTRGSEKVRTKLDSLVEAEGMGLVRAVRFLWYMHLRVQRSTGPLSLEARTCRAPRIRLLRSTSIAMGSNAATCCSVTVATSSVFLRWYRTYRAAMQIPILKSEVMKRRGLNLRGAAVGGVALAGAAFDC